MEIGLRFRDMMQMNQNGALFEWDEKMFAKFAYLQDVRISNNGEQIAYVLTKANLEDDEYKKTIVIENLENGERKYISDASAPRFAPNGTTLTFVRANEEKETNQLMLVDLRTMSAKKLLETKNIFDVRWNQDNRRLLITSSERLEDEDVYFDDKLPIWFNGRGFLSKEEGVLQIFDTDGEELIDKIKVESFVLPYVSDLPMGIWHGDAVIYNVPNRKNPYKLFDIYHYEHNEREKLFEEVSFKALDSNGEVVLLHGKPEKEKLFEHDYLYLWDGEQ
ncbi:MAG: hypothetical protein GWO20_14535, partial [Candidatus Korarchaeota archaeon]|nr:hypothetical protein [Candidatus Korarchaeota archaeon]NIU84640.1 hypothetical protein [Candidatus Thorarchaeota archaeon]NIW14666.1 hypothetical protein [Candidatus Thorarchaeota archaeon]NIW52742.1 hypothetical protein [Candidatus Korarchaeota archaeon]